MRIRAARVSLAFALAAAIAVAGAAGPHAGARFLPRAVVGVAATPAHASAAGLSALLRHHGHDRVNAVDVMLAPATLLAMLLLLAVVVRRSRPTVRLAHSAAQARGPPALR
jgi:hypothetical protein